MGISPNWIFLLLLFSLVGSFVNIPVWNIFTPITYLSEFQKFCFLPPLPFLTKTTVAVNFGGAIIPTLLSFYLMTKAPHPHKTILATFLVSVIVHAFSRPVPHVGITIPTFLPAFSAALSSLLLEKKATPQTAYIAGSIGTLIGADLVNLSQLGHLGTTLVSIGGAGTFDGIFLSGIVAVLLA